MNIALPDLTQYPRARSAMLFAGCVIPLMWIVGAIVIEPQPTCIGTPLEEAELIVGEVK